MIAVLLLAACVLTGAAVLRGAEYDEQYTLFVTSRAPRPDWPVAAFPASLARAMQAPRVGFAEIARALRHTDVHPPLYFWVVSAWRRVVDEGLFASRLLSAAFAVAALMAVGLIAREAGIPAPLAMLLTLGCYGFAYTGAIARGFAMAQMLSLWGVWLLCARRGRMAAAGAGALLGAAVLTNYLAAFVGCAALAWRFLSGWRNAAPALLGFAAFMPAELWFFLAQRNSRDGQFPSFQPFSATVRLARYAGASVFGGLPLYVPPPLGVWVAVALSVLLTAVVVLIAVRWRRLDATAFTHLLGPAAKLPLRPGGTERVGARWGMHRGLSGRTIIARELWRHAAGGVRSGGGFPPSPRPSPPHWGGERGHGKLPTLLAAGAVAPPCGLLLLGAVFGNTPIELRYLAFALPFFALLLAGAIASLPRRFSVAFASAVFCVQALAIAGLLTRPETMQPAREAARETMEAKGGVVLLPRGDDGVGIPAAFAREVPATTRLLVVAADETPADIRARAEGFPRIMVAAIAQDAASRAAVAAMRAAFADQCWRLSSVGPMVSVHERACTGEWVDPRAPESR